MKYVKHLPHYSRPLTAFVLSILAILLCTFAAKAAPVYGEAEIRIAADTVPASELPNIQWGNVSRLVAVNGALKTTLPGGQEIIIKRKDYEEFARRTQDSNDYNQIFTIMAIGPEYPGGLQAWTAFIKKNLRYPNDAVKQNIAGAVIVSFIVEKDGSVTNVEAVSGPTSGGLRDEAVRLVKSSGSWHPGIQNFRIVRAYKKQPVVFWGPNTDW